MLFASDFVLCDTQRTSARIPTGMKLSPEEQRRESMEADREMREHQRWRQFAWLLFVAPILAGVFVALAQWLVMKFMAAR